MSTEINGIRLIATSKKELAKIRDALAFLYDKKMGQKNLHGITTIVSLNRNGYDNLLFPFKKTYLLQKPTVLESSKEYLASLFIHEATHMKQYNSKQKYYGDQAERKAYLAQRKFLSTHGKKSEVKWLENLYSKKWWEFKNEDKSTYISPETKSFEMIIKNLNEGKIKIKKVSI